MAITYHAFIIMFATVMPTPGGAGGAEYTFTLLFGMLLGPAKLLMALVLWRIITYYSCIVFGAGALLIKDTASKKIKPRIEALAKAPVKIYHSKLKLGMICSGLFLEKESCKVKQING